MTVHQQGCLMVELAGDAPASPQFVILYRLRQRDRLNDFTLLGLDECRDSEHGRVGGKDQNGNHCQQSKKGWHLIGVRT